MSYQNEKCKNTQINFQKLKNSTLSRQYILWLQFLTYVLNPLYKKVSIVFSWNLANFSETTCSFSVSYHQNYPHILVTSSLIQPILNILVYSSLFQNIPVYSRIFQSILTYSGIFPPFPAYYSQFQCHPIPAYSQSPMWNAQLCIWSSTWHFVC